MILHFTGQDGKPNENKYINICFDKENYNFDFYPDSKYIEVSREDLNSIFEECVFNNYWYSETLRADHKIISPELAARDAEKKETAQAAGDDPAGNDFPGF